MPATRCLWEQGIIWVSFHFAKKKKKLQTFRCWICLLSLNLDCRLRPPTRAIRTLQLVDWTCLQWAICLCTRWNRCPHLPEAINSKYDSPHSCSAILLPAENNKVELCWSWRGGGKPAYGPQRVMGNYFRQIYTGSHAEWWTTVFDPGRQRKGRGGFSAAAGQPGCRKRGWWSGKEGKVMWLIEGAAQGYSSLLGWWVKWVMHLMHDLPPVPGSSDKVVPTSAESEKEIEEREGARHEDTWGKTDFVGSQTFSFDWHFN